MLAGISESAPMRLTEHTTSEAPHLRDWLRVATRLFAPGSIATRRFVRPSSRQLSCKRPFVGVSLWPLKQVRVAMNDCFADAQPASGRSERLAALEKLDLWVGSGSSRPEEAASWLEGHPHRSRHGRHEALSKADEAAGWRTYVQTRSTANSPANEREEASRPAASARVRRVAGPTVVVPHADLRQRQRSSQPALRVVRDEIPHFRIAAFLANRVARLDHTSCKPVRSRSSRFGLLQSLPTAC